MATIIYRNIKSKFTLQKNKNKVFSLSKINSSFCLQTHSPSKVKPNPLWPHWLSSSLTPSFLSGLERPLHLHCPALRAAPLRAPSSTTLMTSLAKSIAWFWFLVVFFFFPTEAVSPTPEAPAAPPTRFPGATVRLLAHQCPCPPGTSQVLWASVWSSTLCSHSVNDLCPRVQLSG